MKLLNNVYTLVSHKVNNVSKSNNIQNKSNIINGKFKVIPNLNNELHDLELICNKCRKNHQKRQNFYNNAHKDWNELRTGYTDPYTAPIKK